MVKKVITLILLTFIIAIILPDMSYAMDEVLQQGDSFVSIGQSSASPIDQGALKSTSDYVYNILFTIAVVLAVAIGMIIGIQFMIGSAAEQAKVKETLVPYVIGVFIVFASFTIWKIVVTIGNDVTELQSSASGGTDSGTGPGTGGHKGPTSDATTDIR